MAHKENGTGERTCLTGTTTSSSSFQIESLSFLTSTRLARLAYETCSGLTRRSWPCVAAARSSGKALSFSLSLSTSASGSGRSSASPETSHCVSNGGGSSSSLSGPANRRQHASVGLRGDEKTRAEARTRRLQSRGPSGPSLPCRPRCPSRRPPAHRSRRPPAPRTGRLRRLPRSSRRERTTGRRRPRRSARGGACGAVRPSTVPNQLRLIRRDKPEPRGVSGRTVVLGLRNSLNSIWLLNW